MGNELLQTIIKVLINYYIYNLIIAVIVFIMWRIRIWIRTKNTLKTENLEFIDDEDIYGPDPEDEWCEDEGYYEIDDIEDYEDW